MEDEVGPRRRRVRPGDAEAATWQTGGVAGGSWEEGLGPGDAGGSGEELAAWRVTM